MKKKALAILLLSVALSLSACGQSSNNTDNNKDLEELESRIAELLGGTQKYTIYVGYDGVVNVEQNCKLQRAFKKEQMIVTDCNTWIGRESWAGWRT